MSSNVPGFGLFLQYLIEDRLVGTLNIIHQCFAGGIQIMSLERIDDPVMRGDLGAAAMTHHHEGSQAIVQASHQLG